MSRFKPHERDIEERTFEFAAVVATFCDGVESRRASTRVIVSQLLRAATSVGANVSEAGAGQSRADFKAKCSIASKEARETRYWLRLLARTRPELSKRITPLINEVTQLSSILTTIVVRSV